MRETILITGASSGMGREMAVQFSEQYDVIICGRDADRLEQTKKMCHSNGRHIIWQYDLDKIDGVEESLTQFLVGQNLTVSYFVHSAGFMKTVPLKMVSVELFQASFNVNVIAAAMISKVLIKKKINQGALKSIVIISSNISNFGAKAFSAYAASKSASDGLMRCLAVELAPAVRVNSVLPGGVRTAMTEQMYEDEELIKRMESFYPLGLGEVTDIYNAVDFLLSDNARWVTGQQLTVDGGRTINITG